MLFVLAVAENAVDSNSYKPHAIIRSHKGLTVEIGNTDAEGRLVLADALSYASSRHAPHTIIDMATLTGACVVALGEYAAGMFSNSDALASALAAAGATHAERLWRMPIFQEHRDELTVRLQNGRCACHSRGITVPDMSIASATAHAITLSHAIRLAGHALCGLKIDGRRANRWCLHRCR